MLNQHIVGFSQFSGLKKKQTNSRLKEGPETKMQGMYPKKDK